MKKNLSQNAVLYFIQIYVCRFTYLFMASMPTCIYAYTQKHMSVSSMTQALVMPTAVIHVYTGGQEALFSLLELK